MSTRPVDDAARSIERWRAGEAAAEFQASRPVVSPAAGATLVGQSGTCPTCGQQHRGYHAGAHDEDYDYYWGEWRLPLWIALIWKVPWRQRLDIFVIGFLVGLTVAGIALLWGLLLSQY